METRKIVIAPHHELRVISDELKHSTIKILSPHDKGSSPPQNTVEIFGAELPTDTEFVIPPGRRLSCFTWGGCVLQATGIVAQAYEGQNIAMKSYANLCSLLNSKRELSRVSRGAESGPNVLICGAVSSGKSSVAQLLLNYAVRSGWTPTFIQLDPRGSTDKPELNFPVGVIGACVRDEVRFSGVYPHSVLEEKIAMSSNTSVQQGLPMTNAVDLDPVPFELRRKDGTSIAVFYGKRTAGESFSLYQTACKQLANAVARPPSEATQAAMEGSSTRLLRGASGSVIDCSAQLDANNIVDLAKDFKVTNIVVIDDASLKYSLTSILQNTHPNIKVISVPKAEGVVSTTLDKRNAYAFTQVRKFFVESRTHVVKFSIPSACVLGTFEVNAAPLSALPFGHKTPNEDRIMFGQFMGHPSRLIKSIVGLTFPDEAEDDYSLFVQNVGIVKSVEVIREDPMTYIISVAVQSGSIGSTPPKRIIIGPSLLDARQ